MRLQKTQKHLQMLGIRYDYIEIKGLGRLYIGDKLIKEHWTVNKRTNIYAEEINLIDETQLIGWINTNADRLK